MLGQTNSEVSFYTLVYSAFSIRINEEDFFLIKFNELHVLLDF